ncbi:sensor domain-containing diguanylate cyclase [Alteromonas sp. a30]|uniref:sensor domain-containing diguanylate cyclase n=1 Tax=Alteromonas sp. a30 TaxID=2730917 RepID=UPI00227FE208|nr:diguanylate cyclase [Alteromonas sp. a30]MCY7295360.1 diguanylate cyclase [Alteromonas sp. a30]
MMAPRHINKVLSQIPTWLMGVIICFSFWGLFTSFHPRTTPLPDQTIDRGVSYYVADSEETSINTVFSLSDRQWTSQQNDSLFSPIDNQTLWLKFNLPALDPMDNWLLEVDQSQLDFLNIWFLENNNILASYFTGDQMPFRSRGIAHERFLFPIPQHEKSDLTVFIKLSNELPSQLPIHLWRERSYLVFNGEHNLALGLFFGFMLAMAVSNFFFFISSGSTNFLLYSGYAISVTLMLISMHGLGYKYFWPGNIWLQNHSIGIFASSSLLFALLFIRQLLDIAKYSRVISRSLEVLCGVYLICLIVSFTTDSRLAANVLMLFVTVTSFYIIGAGIWLWRAGLKVSRVYALAWFTILMTALFASVHGLQLYTSDFAIRYILMAGTLIETLLLALLLARSFSQQASELVDAQKTALKQEHEARLAKERIIEVQEEANVELEYKVQERTLELEITLRELEEKNQALEALNTIDSLTGIKNRRFFDKKYPAELRLSRRNQTELSVVMLDIDHFKKINDTYGHLAGDVCLHHVAQMIKNSLKRPGDEACRFGGEEFALLLPQTDEKGATQLVEKIRQQIAQHTVVYEEDTIQLTVSAGICSAIHTGDDEQTQLLETADKALYEAKQAGRNRVVYKTYSKDAEGS